MPEVEGDQQPDGIEDREPIKIRNDTSGKWTRQLASIDRSLPRRRIDLQTLREVCGEEVDFRMEEHSHPGLRGICIGTIDLRFQSLLSAAGDREFFCIVRDENRRVVLNRSLKPDNTQATIFPIANQGNVNSRDQNRNKEEAKQKAKQREKEKSKQKDDDRRDKDKEIRASSSTQQPAS